MKLRLLSPSPDGTISTTFALPQDKAPFSIGRTKNNQFCIEETAMSASHARIEVSDKGEYELLDLDSSNGTFVNENKITRTEIHSGDIIRFANTRFFFEQADAKEPDPKSTTTEPVTISAPADISVELGSLKNALWKKDAKAVELQKSLDTEKSENARLSSDLTAARDSNELLTKNLSEAQSSNNSLSHDLADLRKRLESEQSRATQLSTDLSASQDSNELLTKSLSDTQASNNSLGHDLADLRKRLESEQSKATQLSTDLSASQNSNETFKHSLSSERATIESLNLTQKDLQNALHSEESRSTGLSADLSESQDSNQSLTQNLGDANANIESLQLTQNDLSARHTELEKAILETLEDAKSIQISLNSDWQRWTGEADSKASSTAIAKAPNSHNGIAAIAAILVDLINARAKMRPELDKIEAIWDKCGPDVERFLTDICSELKDEITRLSNFATLREKTIKELEADLLTLRQGIDEQLRKSQTLNREGIHCEIPEEMEKMILATDTEETIFRKIVARIDTINELSVHYHKKLTSRKIAKSLDSLRDDFLDLLKEHSVTPFTFDKGAILTKRDSAEVDLISSGHGKNSPSHMDGPVKVIQTLYPGIILKVGDKEIIIKKAKVQVKPA